MNELKDFLTYIYTPPGFFYLMFIISCNFGSFVLSKNLFSALEASGINLNKEAKKKWGKFFYWFLIAIFMLHLSLVLFFIMTWYPRK